MDWSYIAGFFDGEGTIYLEKNKGLWRVSIINTNKEVIESLQKFIGFGFIYTRKNNHLGKKQVYEFHIYDQRKLIVFIENILPYSIVKKERLQQALDWLKKRKWHKNYKLQNISKEELEELYNEMSMREIAKRLNVHYNAIYEALDRFGIPKRSMSEAAKLRRMKKGK